MVDLYKLSIKCCDNNNKKCQITYRKKNFFFFGNGQYCLFQIERDISNSEFAILVTRSFVEFMGEEWAHCYSKKFEGISKKEIHCVNFLKTNTLSITCLFTRKQK